MARYDPDKHHRRSTRLKGYDCSQAGAYFVTIATHEREPLFGQVVGEEMVLNEYGRVMEAEWYGLPERFPTIRLDAFVVMPNHVHFIVWLNPPGARLNRAPTIGELFTVDPERPTLGQIARAFKAVVTRRICQAGEEGFAWQRNYYERVIRNERELETIRRYIQDNPARWAEGAENPDCLGATQTTP